MTDKPTNRNGNTYVLDASVAVKFFAEEEGSETARALWRKAEMGEIRLLAPDLLLYEIGNVLGKAKRLQEPTIIEALHLLFESSLEFFPPEERTLDIAEGFMKKYEVTFYDASYAALAYKFGIPLISENPKDHGKIKEIEVKNLASLKNL
ncbi:MAG: type II toxin-antitoxin system VapC family toxin [Patescibacteria group bacterium]